MRSKKLHSNKCPNYAGAADLEPQFENHWARLYCGNKQPQILAAYNDMFISGVCCMSAGDSAHHQSPGGSIFTGLSQGKMEHSISCTGS